jgi:hypothetical protein
MFFLNMIVQENSGILPQDKSLKRGVEKILHE